MPTQVIKKIFRIYKMILPHAWSTKGAKKALFLTMGLIGADIVVSTHFPYLWKDLINTPIATKPSSWFIQKSIFLFITWIFIRNASRLKELTLFPIINQTIKSLRLATILKVHTTSLKNLETYQVQEIISATSRISQSVRNFMRVSFISIIPSIAKIVSLSIALCATDKLCFFIILSACISLLAANLTLHYYQHAKYKAWHLTDNVNNLMEQHAANTATIRFDFQTHSEHIKKLFNLEAHAWQAHNLWFYLLYLIEDSIFFLGSGITFCLLILRYLQGSIDAGTITLIYGIISSLQNPLSEIIRNFTRLVGGIIDINKTLDILSLPSTNKPLALDNLLPQNIRLNQISFGYDHGKKLLNQVTLTIHQGDKVGIFGPSGTGKSTLCKIIAGLIEPDQGTILYGNLPIGQIDTTSLGQILSYIPQINPMQRLTEEPHHHGVNLKKVAFSGGEYQLTLLREALKKKPQIIILDEAFNALDERSAMAIMSEIIEKVPTVILVSHSSTLLNHMQRIFEVKNRQLIEKNIEH